MFSKFHQMLTLMCSKTALWAWAVSMYAVMSAGIREMPTGNSSQDLNVDQARAKIWRMIKLTVKNV